MHHIQHWELRSASAHRLSVDSSCVLRVTEGRVWITLEQGSEDIWLLPGQEWCAPRPVCIWISADYEARLQLLTPAVSRVVPGGQAAWRRWFKRANQVLVSTMAPAAR